MGRHLNKKDRWWLRQELWIPMAINVGGFTLLGLFGGK